MASNPEVTLRLRAAKRLLRAANAGHLPRWLAIRGAARLTLTAVRKLRQP